MSGLQRTKAKHSARDHASPYSRSRPVKPKRSTWALGNLFSFLMPSRNKYEEESEDEGESSDHSRDDEGAQERNDGDEMDVEQPNYREESEHSERESIAPAPSKPPPPPRGPPSSIPESISDVHNGHTPSKNFQEVTRFLAEKKGQRLNKIELAGLVSLLQETAEEEDKDEPFRFSISPLASPGRGTSPSFNLFSTSVSAPAFAGTTNATGQTPRKTLARNPNGVYRWQGAGSAKPRNRFQSPGFGPSRSAPSRIKITPERPTTDNKRRRVGPEPESSTSQRASAPRASQAPAASTPNGNASAPVPSVSLPNGTGALANDNAGASASAPPRANGAPPPPTTPRIRTNNLPVKATAPAIPSPLRQTWGQTESPSPPHLPASRPTRAANIMAELIKEVTPPKKPDFSNPYEAASPVPMKPVPRKQPPKRSRTSMKAEEIAAAAAAGPKVPFPKKETELSPQKIIEATVPKGSKRSRPPKDLEKAKVDTASFEPIISPRRSMRLQTTEPSGNNNNISNGVNGLPRPNGRTGSRTVTIEEVSDEEEPSPKRIKKRVPSTNGATFPTPQSMTVEVLDWDVDMPQSDSSKYIHPSQVLEPEEMETSPTSSAPTSSLPSSSAPAVPAKPLFGGLKSSAPKAPSKLRFGFRADEDEREKEKEPESKVESSTAPAKATPSAPLLPSFAPSSTSPASISQPPKTAPKTKEEVRASVISMNVTDLPTYSFTFPTSSPGAGPGPSSQKAREAAKAAQKSSLPTFDFSITPPKAPVLSSSKGGFDWSAAGVKPPTTPAGDTWTCSTCMLSNPASATEKCTVCETPRVAKPSPASTATFNWAAAGIKQPEKKGGSDGTWTCSTCMLSNPATAKDKCTVCETPRS